ncbi:MAG TPA: alpha/beta hydrolase [Candidatus Paceibacterota bacterium]|nr:alpha/beta hydrolase [Candidatus Paceibacterota bacterium]
MKKPGVEGKYVRTRDGHQMYYETAIVDPNAPVVVLVHGIGGDVDGWEYVRNVLNREGMSTVALDVRGHGYSAHPRPAKYYQMELLVKDIVHVIDAEGLKRVILVGHSGGAILALNFALAHHERLDGLVLLAGSYKAPAYMRSRFTKFLAQTIISLGAFVSHPHLGEWHSTYPKGKHHKEYELWGLARTIMRNSLRSYLLVSRELMSIDLEHRLAEITVPTLLLVGEKDSIYPLVISQQMHKKIPNSRLEVVPGANHVLILNNIEETAGHIIDFVRSHT